MDPIEGRGPEAANLIVRDVSESFAPPGLACCVWKDGDIVWESESGFANMEEAVAMTTTTPIRISSLSKPMTALAAALLHERGLTDLDCSVQRYVPEFPHRDISCRHLITHTSGLRHFRNNSEQKLAVRF